jgi:cephalosporin hydroxylase
MKLNYKKILGPTIYNFLYEKYITKSLKHTISCIELNDGNFDAISGTSFLFSKDAKHIKPMQFEEELVELAKIIYDKKPKVVLEIGTARGGTLFLAAQLADDNALIISIDLPDGMYGGGYPEWKIPLYKSFKKKNQNIELIQGDSHSKEILNKLTTILNGKKIDYLFIDGDHTYEGVKADFETYTKLLNTNAIVGFHDIVSDKSDVPNHFVYEFWNEIKSNYQYKEFIKNKNQSKLGLGVLEIN